MDAYAKTCMSQVLTDEQQLHPKSLHTGRDGPISSNAQTHADMMRTQLKAALRASMYKSRMHLVFEGGSAAQLSLKITLFLGVGA